jgi:hypothetical protein
MVMIFLVTTRLGRRTSIGNLAISVENTLYFAAMRLVQPLGVIRPLPLAGGGLN